MSDEPASRSSELHRAVSELSPDRRALLNSRLAAKRASRRRSAIEPLPRTGGVQRFPATSGQERLHFQWELAPKAPLYLLPCALRMTGTLDERALSGALTALLDRHEVLRTGFTMDGGHGLLQVVRPTGELRADLVPGEVADDEIEARVGEFARRPFDLSAPPLLRAELWRVTGADAREKAAPGPEAAAGPPRDGDGTGGNASGTEGGWVLALCVHHIVVDGWSLGVLVGELMALYRAAVAGEPAELPDLPLQYADFAAWERGRLSGAERERQLGEWRDALRGVPSLDLPGDRPRPVSPSFDGASVPLELPAELVDRLTRSAAGESGTLFMALMSAFAVVLGRWSGEETVLIGTPVAGRPRPELEGLVGFFVNTLPLPIRVPDDRSFRELLRATRTVALEGFARQDVPYEQIARATAAGNTGGRPAPLRAVLALRNVPARQLRLPGVTVEELETPRAGTDLDLALELVPAPDGSLTGWLSYANDLFDRHTTERIVGALRSVLDAAADGPDTAIGSLPLSSAAERDFLLREFSGTDDVDRPFPDLLDPFRLHAAATPDAVAIVTDTDGEPAPDPAGTVTFGRLAERANRLAHWLVRSEVRPEDRVAVCLERGPELVVAALAVLTAGAVLVPLDSEHPAGRLRQLVEDARPRIVLSSAATGDRLPADSAGSAPRAVRPADLAEVLEALPTDPPATAVHPDNAAYILYTSGSTGRPKGVVVSRAAIANRLHGMRADLGFDKQDTVLHKTPVSADTAMWELLLPLTTGGRLVLAAPRRQADPGYIAGALTRHAVTGCFYVPSLLRSALDHTGFTVAARGLRMLVCAGEQLPTALSARLLTLLPDIRLINSYGPTETTINVAEHEVTAPVSDPVPIGRPVAGADLYVTDPAGRLQPIGVPGELLVGGVQVARGYHGRPGRTAERYVPHPFRAGQRLYRTGDRARWLPDGTLEYLGRLDDQVKIRGLRIEPGEVEAALRAHPAVGEAVVLARPDARGELRLVAYLTSRPDGPAMPDTGEFRRELRRRLPLPMVPTGFLVLDRFPVTAYGKLDRAALPDLPAAGPARAEPVRTPPGDALQRVLAGIWSQVLDATDPGMEDDFFDQGGHSLLATMMVSKIRELFRVELPLHFFVEAPTIGALTELIRRQGRAGGVDVDRMAALVERVQRMSPDEISSRLEN